MADLKIHTTLDVCQQQAKHKHLSITRGATAMFVYNLVGKYFTFDQIEQIIFMFKQDKNIRWYQMFNYIIPTTDTEVNSGKVYYKNVELIDATTKQCYGELVEDPVKSELPTYYEQVGLEDGQKPMAWVLNKHFNHNFVEDSIDNITFNLSSEETKYFDLTTPSNNVQFEIAFRFDTDSAAALSYTDSVLIEPQPSIIVVDSLFSRLYNEVASSEGLTVSEAPNRVVSSDLTVQD